MSQNQVFDLDEALAQVDHDEDFLQTIAKLFVVPGPKDLAEIKSASAARDAATVARALRGLKGAILHSCAPAVFETAKTLEQAGNAGDVKAAVEVCAEPETEVLRLVVALCQALDKGPAE